MQRTRLDQGTRDWRTSLAQLGLLDEAREGARLSLADNPQLRRQSLGKYATISRRCCTKHISSGVSEGWVTGIGSWPEVTMVESRGVAGDESAIRKSI